MDKVVVDSSVAIKWFVVEPHSTEARRLLGDFQNGSISLAAPDLIYAEIGNIVWKKLRIESLTEQDAQEIIDTFWLLNLEATASVTLLPDAYRIAVEHQRTVYDSLYLALSLREKCPFVTADERLVNAVCGTFADIMLVSAWPSQEDAQAESEGKKR